MIAVQLLVSKDLASPFLKVRAADELIVKQIPTSAALKTVNTRVVDFDIECLAKLDPRFF